MSSVEQTELIMSKQIAKIAALSALLLMGLGPAGCASEDPLDPINAQTPRTCQSDAECAPGLICRLDICSATATTTRKLEFTFLPSNASGYLPQRTGALNINPNDELSFELLPSLKVEGTISRSDDPQPTSGTLIFERSEEQNKERLYTRQSDVRQGSFLVELVPGEYDVTFLPSDDRLPPRVWRDQRFELNSDFSRALLIPRTISGNVSYREPSADPNALPRFVPQAKVVAVSRDTGDLSTIGYTDDQGYFTLNVWPDTGVYDLVVAPSKPDALVPTVVFSEALDTSGPNATQALSLGEYTAQGARVLLTLPDSVKEQLDFSPADLRITLRASLGKGTLQLNARFAQIGSLGRDDESLWALDVELLPLNYEIELTPPASSRYARTTITRALSNLSDDPIILSLNEKLPIQGQLLYQGPGGESMPSVNTEIKISLKQETKKVGGLNSNDQQDPILVTTDEQGRFYTHLEARDYELEVTPRAETGQPKQFYSLEAAQVEETAQGRDLIWQLPSPVVVAGTVYDDLYRGQADLAVQIHEVYEGKRRLVAQGQTSRQGVFKLVLPQQ